jgi:hypothetical protein
LVFGVQTIGPIIRKVGKFRPPFHSPERIKESEKPGRPTRGDRIL